MPSCLARLAVTSEVGTPWTRRRPFRMRSPRALTKAWAARPEPRPIRELFGTNSRTRSTMVTGNFLRAGLFLAESRAQFLLLCLGRVSGDNLELHVLCPSAKIKKVPCDGLLDHHG